MLALVLLVCVAGIGAGIAVAANHNARTGAVLHSPATVSVSATANEEAAQTDASWLLTQISLPASATRSAGEPADDEGQLEHPSIGPAATPNVVDSHAWWVLPGVRSEVLAYIHAHRPPGTTIAFSGSAVTRGRTTSESVAFAWPPIAGVLGMRWLVITVTQIPDGQTGLRADAQVVWITPRPVSEAIPGDTHLLRISVHSAIAANQPHQRPLRVTSAHKIAQLIVLLNSLSAAQPGVRSCPADFGISVRLAFYPTFRGSPSAVAEIDPQGCGGVGLTLNGKPQPQLSGEPPPMQGQPPTGSLIGHIDRTLGVKLRVTPSR
jgi:hypothetical protein